MRRRTSVVLLMLAVAACRAPAPPSRAEVTAQAPSDTLTTVAAAPVASPGLQPDAPPIRDAYHTAPLDTVDARTYQGWKYYNLNCARCHGEDVQGTSIAPHLVVSLRPDGAVPNEGIFLQTVCSGRVDKGMPAWCKLGLSTAQIDTIYTYVKARSDAKMHAGRPARRGT